MSPVLPLGEDGLHVENRRSVDGFHLVDLDPRALNGKHSDLVESDGVRPVRGPGGEDALGSGPDRSGHGCALVALAGASARSTSLEVTTPIGSSPISSGPVIRAPPTSGSGPEGNQDRKKEPVKPF
jgi:hypothetical protein